MGAATREPARASLLVKLATVGAGDLVLVSKGGRRFHARVVGITEGVVRMEPLERGISYRHASAREVIDHWRHARRRRGPDDATVVEQAPPALAPPAQLSFAGQLEQQPGPKGG